MLIFALVFCSAVVIALGWAILDFFRDPYSNFREDWIMFLIFVAMFASGILSIIFISLKL